MKKTKKLISLITAFFTVVLSFSTVFSEGYENEIWENASDWAFSELNEANDKNLIPDVLKEKDFTENISREEFASLQTVGKFVVFTIKFA